MRDFSLNFCILHCWAPWVTCSWWKSKGQVFNNQCPQFFYQIIILVLIQSMINITIIKISGDSWLTTGHPLSSIMYNSDLPLRWLPHSSSSLQIQDHTRGLLQVALPHVGESVKNMFMMALTPGFALTWPWSPRQCTGGLLTSSHSSPE